jgi:hypothetical protein
LPADTDKPKLRRTGSAAFWLQTAMINRGAFDVLSRAPFLLRVCRIVSRIPSNLLAVLGMIGFELALSFRSLMAAKSS